MTIIVDAIRCRFDRLTGRELNAEESKGKAILERLMCTHVAWALLIHTVMVVLLIGHDISSHENGMLGQMVVIAMISLFVLIARHFHYRWQIHEAKRRSPELARMITGFQRDLAILWLLALGLPFVWLAFI